MMKLNYASFCGMEITPGIPPPALGVLPDLWPCKRLLTSGGWVKGWNRSPSPESSFSHLTISPPGRRSPSGRLPEAPAPSPSRTQVCNDRMIEIQQLSHISLSPLCPYFSVRVGGASHCALPLLVRGVFGVTDAAERLRCAVRPQSIHTGAAP